MGGAVETNTKGLKNDYSKKNSKLYENIDYYSSENFVRSYFKVYLRSTHSNVQLDAIEPSCNRKK